ncbi:uncharacterized protein LOC121864413 isoform X3 [Homarus americanus]|uniref:uncharacterized protein LOC121857364 isoform X2 n=1 Tax=Homarus americanus TaxID=6706 RepID=UPI001C470659|nr:uncharacterized protein LOC121857364 isoform X2 [Homarus americanus]XP_042219371.1 uncharacterized protein LOC121864413 isoform X3 [Homarus americanus]
MSSTVRQKGTRAMTPVKHSPRTFAGSKTGCTVRELATAYQNHIGETLNEVEELTSEECEVTHSPAHVTRHARVRHAKLSISPDPKGGEFLIVIIEICKWLHYVCYVFVYFECFWHDHFVLEVSVSLDMPYVYSIGAENRKLQNVDRIIV